MQIKDIGNSCGIVYHYTKLASAVGIIRREGIIFHAGRYDAMNDPHDSVYGAQTTMQDLGEELSYALIDPNTFDINSYLVSFSKNEDDFIMWDRYKAEVILHIDSDVIKEACEAKSKMMLIKDVEYLPTKEVTRRATDVFSEANKYFNDKERDFEAKTHLSFIKGDNFKDEKEWRVAWFDDYNTIDDTPQVGKLLGDFIASEVKEKGTRYGRLALYRELKFPKDCLKAITLRVYDNKNFNILRAQIRIWLASQGYDVSAVKIYKTNTQEVR